MNNLSLRNVLIVLGALIAGLIILGVISTVLTQIVPLAIVAIVAFVLGRLSVNVNLLDVVRNALSSAATAATTPAEKPAARPAVTKAAPPQKDPLPKTDQLPQTDRLDKAKSNMIDSESEPKPLEDFVIKSEAEILAEARQREAELSQKKNAAADDVAAALEERRRRLLGDQSDKN